MSANPQEPAIPGAVQVIEVGDTTCAEVQGCPPTVTVAPERNAVPVIVRAVVVLFTPLGGETAVTVGAGLVLPMVMSMSAGSVPVPVPVHAATSAKTEAPHCEARANKRFLRRDIRLSFILDWLTGCLLQGVSVKPRHASAAGSMPPHSVSFWMARWADILTKCGVPLTVARFARFGGEAA